MTQKRKLKILLNAFRTPGDSSRDYLHPDDQAQPTFEMTRGFKPFTTWVLLDR